MIIKVPENIFFCIKTSGKFFAIILGLIIVIPIKLHSLTAHSGADFLKIGASARAVSLAEVQSADPRGDFFYNPAAPAAGFFLIKQPDAVGNRKGRQKISFSHIAAIEESNLENFTYTTYAGRLGFISLGVMLFHVKPIPVTLNSPDPIGELVWRDFAFSVNISRRVNQYLTGGVTLKHIYRYTENPIFGKTEGKAFALDGGVIIKPLRHNERLLLGASFANYGTLMVYEPKEPKNDELPFTSRFGLRWTAYSDGFDSVFFLTDFIKTYGDDRYRPQFGCELSFRESFYLRGGYTSRAGEIEGICVGFGYDGGFYIVDLANSPSGDLGRSSAVTLSIKW